ncbi:SsgA family sporulation/cell division regulator [Streptomyces erythrochromogenes]|uniref:SsgA family sporulation/cell division regulator n=1 Tax=Streptomyces erythrochromogenes TaxID=285574 RepID=UPI0036AA3119
METTPRSGSARRDARWSTFARQYLPHGAPLTIPVTFSYRRSDPLCVRAVFHCPHGNDVTWVLGRDVLAAATRTLTGSSDIIGWPDPVDGRLWLRLGPSPDHALLSLDRDQLTAWLQITYTLVPPGTEEDHLDWTPIHLLLAC